MSAKTNRSNNRILIMSIFQAGLYHQVYVIMFPVYSYKNRTFLYKTCLLQAFMSHSLRVPAQIKNVKMVKMVILFTEVLLTLHLPRGNSQTTFHSPACTILITLVFLLQQSDIWLPRYRPGIAPVFGFFAFFALVTPVISRAKAIGIRPFLQLVPRPRYAPQ